MCGIAGALVFSESNFEVTPDYITRMRDTMPHRGPDGAGNWISSDRRVGLGHRRLAIIDLSDAASQPMSSPDDSLWISFNGEIYNHAEIRKELEALGDVQWKTDHSDTEVILHAFRQWGIDCLQKFRGMFAFALWDAGKRQLWLVRDRIGVKPLYYSIHHGRVTFASEIKALLQDPNQQRAVNEEGLYHYLSFLTTPAPQTLFDGIRKLPPATWMRFDEHGGCTEHRYWDVWDHTVPLDGVSEDEIAERILCELREAVELRKVADVPVGIFLSGGIDSSTNAALFSEGNRLPLQTFTIGYQGQWKGCENETHYARLMAGRVQSNHHELLLSMDDLLRFLPQMVHLQDEPLGDPVCVPVYYVSKLARDHNVTVCQVGEGADELFWGYPLWKLKLRLQQWNDAVQTPAFLKTPVLAGMRACGLGASAPYDALLRSSRGQPIFWGSVDAFTEAHKHQLLSPRLRKRFFNFSSWETLQPTYERFRTKAWEQNALQWMTYADLNLRLPELLLMRVDKMSMGASLEGRVPFLDHRFVELAMSIPARVKTRNGTLKHILKKSVRRLIPDELIDRPKQGFGVPVHEWMFDRLGDQVHAELSQFCDETDLLDRESVMQLARAKRGAKCWYLLNLALWWKQFIR